MSVWIHNRVCKERLQEDIMESSTTFSWWWSFCREEAQTFFSDTDSVLMKHRTLDWEMRQRNSQAEMEKEKELVSSNDKSLQMTERSRWESEERVTVSDTVTEEEGGRNLERKSNMISRLKRKEDSISGPVLSSWHSFVFDSSSMLSTNDFTAGERMKKMRVDGCKEEQACLSL